MGTLFSAWFLGRKTTDRSQMRAGEPELPDAGKTPGVDADGAMVQAPEALAATWRLMMAARSGVGIRSH